MYILYLDLLPVALDVGLATMIMLKNKDNNGLFRPLDIGFWVLPSVFSFPKLFKLATLKKIAFNMNITLTNNNTTNNFKVR